MRNMVKDGNVVTRTAPSGGVVSGLAYLIGSQLVVATFSAAQGDPFEGVTKGVVTLVKATGEAWTEGEKLYWDNSAHKATATSSANTLIGVADAAAGSSDATGDVYLDGVAR